GEQNHDVRPGRAREQISKPREPSKQAWRERIGRDGEKTGMLHPIGRINALNRGNLAKVRQIESARSSRLACPPRNRHIDPYEKTRPGACSDRCSVHAPRRGKEWCRLLDSRPPHVEPCGTAASHPGHRSLRALLLVKRQ